MLHKNHVLGIGKWVSWVTRFLRYKIFRLLKWKIKLCENIFTDIRNTKKTLKNNKSHLQKVVSGQLSFGKQRQVVNLAGKSPKY